MSIADESRVFLGLLDRRWPIIAAPGVYPIVELRLRFMLEFVDLFERSAMCRLGSPSQPPALAATPPFRVASPYAARS